MDDILKKKNELLMSSEQKLIRIKQKELEAMIYDVDDDLRK